MFHMWSVKNPWTQNLHPLHESECNDRLRFAVRGLCRESEDKQYRATSESSRSPKRIKFVGLNVHAETLAVAKSEVAPDGSRLCGFDPRISE
jgi:hypothetical protein